MIDKKTFKKIITSPFDEADFVKKGQSWYLDGEDAVIVVNLQKSNWADEYYVNIGIWIKALSSIDFPKENQYHLLHRLERCFPEDRELIQQSTSLELSNLQALSKFTEFLKLRVVPFLRDCTRKHKLREFMAAGKFRSGFVHKDVINYLG